MAASPYRDPASDSSWLEKLGVKALATGAITPQQAAANAASISKLRTGPYGPSPAATQSAANIGQVQAQMQPGAMGLPPAQPGSGLTDKLSREKINTAQTKSSEGTSDKSTTEDSTLQSLKDTSSTGHTVNAGQTLAPDQMNTVEDWLAHTPEGQASKAGTDQLQNRIKMMEGMPVKTDWRPMMAALDAMTGSHQAEATPAVPGVESRNAMIMQYMQKLQTDRAAQLNSAISAVKASKSGSVIDKIASSLQNLNQTGQKSGTAATTTMSDQNTNTNVNKSGQSETSADPLSGKGGSPVMAASRFNTYAAKQLQNNDKSAEELRSITAEVASGNPIDDNRIAVLRAKMDANGRPNIAEVNMEAGDKSLMERAQQMFQTASEGKLTDHNRALMLQSLQTIAALKQKERDMYVSKLSNQGAKQYMQTPEQLDAAFPASYTKRFQPAVDEAGKAQQDIVKRMSGAQGPHGPTVTQGDHTFHWNPQSRKYE